MDSKLQTISGTGIPLLGNDIDTDRIIPARYLKCITFDGLAQGVFADDRTQAQGQHPFDAPQYQGAKILIVNGNFGCGSSREHAPQAIARWGIQAIIGESFAEIFLGNCGAIGLCCVTADTTAIPLLQQQVQQNPQGILSVDLETMLVTAADHSIPIHMGDGARQMIRSGTWDTCGQLVGGIDAIRKTAQTIPYLAWR